jgi:hypothetical protein
MKNQFEEVLPETVNTQNQTPDIQQAEWCFQFFENEPVVFGWTKDETKSSNLVIELRPHAQDALTFSQNGMSFRIFPREMSEESKKLRAEQKAKEHESKTEENPS